MIVVYVVIFVAIVWLYVCWYCYNHYRKDPMVVSRTISGTSTPSSITPVNEGSSPSDGRLDAGVLLLLPVFVYSAATAQQTLQKLECTVCLAEFKDGDKVRPLPNCCHCFHAECIDMWFSSHSTCPICRAAVDPQLAT